jgi:hypothetical protein
MRDARAACLSLRRRAARTAARSSARLGRTASAPPSSTAAHALYQCRRGTQQSASARTHTSSVTRRSRSAAGAPRSSSALRSPCTALPSASSAGPVGSLLNTTARHCRTYGARSALRRAWRRARCAPCARRRRSPPGAHGRGPQDAAVAHLCAAPSELSACTLSGPDTHLGRAHTTAAATAPVPARRTPAWGSMSATARSASASCRSGGEAATSPRTTVAQRLAAGRVRISTRQHAHPD